jgi:hypothetical protein
MISGFYYDPKHGGCLRRIKKTEDGSYMIVGVYGNDEKSTGKVWTAAVTYLDQEKYKVDFSGKPFKLGPRKEQIFQVRGGGDLFWDDGNVWKKLYFAPEQLSNVKL